MRKVLVVCKYEKDTSWTERIKVWEPYIVHNGFDRPNEGREPGAFFWAINKLYDSVKDRDIIAFLQDDPDGNGPYGSREDVISEIKPVTKFTSLGTWKCVCDGNGNPFHSGLPVKEKYEKWLKKPFPGWIQFTAGGQFIVTGKELKKHPREFYQHLEEEMSKGENAWVMERLWPSLFVE